jgi:hypothetical protein
MPPDKPELPEIEPLKPHDLFIIRECIATACRQKVARPAHRERLIQLAEHTFLRAYLAMDTLDELTLTVKKEPG